MSANDAQRLEEALSFLTVLFGEVKRQDLYFYLWTFPDKTTHSFPATQEGIERAAAKAIELSKTMDVYVSATLQDRRLPSKERDKGDRVAGMVALWADIDVDGLNHKSKNYPPTFEAAEELLDMIGLAPSMVVRTGGGLHAWWTLEEPWIFESDEERQEGAELARNWNVTAQRHAAAEGWVVDSTHDLTRVLRVPGTFNRKHGGAEPVTLSSSDEVAFDLTEIESHLVPVEAASGHAPRRRGAPAAPVKVNFELDPDANPPLEKVEALRANHDRFAATLDRNRQDLADQSASSYDLSLANITARAGWSDQEIVDLLIAQRRRYADDLKLDRADYYQRTLRKARDRNLGQGPSGRPVIFVTNSEHHEMLDTALDALAKANEPPSLFVRDGKLTRVRTGDTGRPLIEPHTHISIGHDLSKAAQFVKPAKEGVTNVAPPDLVRRGILELHEKPGIPHLKGVSRVPIVRADGTICMDPGYDPASQFLYLPLPGLVVPAPPARPTAEQVADAVAVLDDVFGEFPFVSGSDRANTYALMLTAMLTCAIDGHRPLAVITSPMRGTGKSLVAELIFLISAGRQPSSGTAPDSKEEWRKRLTALLSNGDSFVLFDNVDDELGVSHFTSVLTTEIWTDRELGLNKILDLPNHSTFVVTGNNIGVGGDMGRRCYVVNLDAMDDRPWSRTGFRHPNLRKFVRAHLGELIGAALILIQNWYSQGQPESETPTLGSFEDWTRINGGILASAGIDGFLANQDDVYDRIDRGDQEWYAFLTWWDEAIGERDITTRELTEIISAEDDGAVPLPTVIAMAVDKRSFSNILGSSLARRAGARHSGGIYIERAGKDRRGVALWRLKRH